MRTSTSTRGTVLGSTEPALAPAWHTALLALLFCASGLFPVAAPASTRHAVMALLGMELLVLAYVVAGLGSPARDVLRLLGAPRPRAWDLLAGVVAAGAIFAMALLWQRLWPDAVPSSVHLLPGFSGRLGWAALAVAVAVSEELTFRGYLQRQLESFGASAAMAAVLQAALFAVAHASQGFSAALRVGLIGVGLAALVHRSGSLWPAIVAHALYDACL